ncbi:MAG TPA: aminomethyltransferase family protein [Steroidobacteraceae bacterium]|nr:aminomethyltransferase family protein [Steroidobacteraceae bacterium]
MLKTTPFHARTAPLVLGQTWRRWAGYQAASSYDWVHDREYAAIRNSAALLDVSPLYKYAVTGRDAGKLLDRMVTRNVAKTKVGQVLYTPWCDAHGKTIDDGTVSRLGENLYRLTAAEPNYRWLHQNAFGLDVKIEDVSEALGALALQGPLSRAVLNAVAEHSVDDLKYFRLMDNRVAGVNIQISRTGYTGDLGYEIWIPTAGAIAVWDALMAEGSNYGITPAGVWALDVARIEAGLVMLDVDYHSSHHAMIDGQKSSPYELSLDWTVNLDKDLFNGKAALKAELARGPAWRFVGIEVDWDSFEALFTRAHLAPALPTVAWRTSVPIYRGGEQVGYASSGCWSPLLKKYLALAHLRAPHFAPDTPVEIEVTVEHQRQRADARVRKLPFFDPPRKKA